eukprot:TRINITY_DN6343_c0_g1_i2.p1 TRINITY_DN6343_c0_g1~~TRINITY_DN6343_c0_g1_i2.p1  ORF type:complete len:229 (+),score=56.05 TRINITY_DN6343_c0_g1_i2:172-858(+)
MEKEISLEVGMLLYTNLTQLDLTGPYEIFSRMPNTKIHLISINMDPVKTEHGLCILPTKTIDEMTKLDVILVPGGPGIMDALKNEKITNFVKRISKECKYITSVCTGSLLLGVCGLLEGYKATTHWLSLDILAVFKGVEVVQERVVIDRNRITAGGVTSGIDFVLVIASQLFGKEVAQKIQLMVEYDPPFTGSPLNTDMKIVELITEERKEIQKNRKEEIEKFISQNK